MNTPGKPCRVCDDFKGWTKDISGKNKTKTQSDTDPTSIHGRSTSKTNLECPPGYKELGNSTWTFLHSTAAYYPDKPNEIEKKSMLNLLNAVSNIYPCQPCAEHMKQEIKDNPPKVGSKLEASKWLCWFHNRVNILLDKPVFDCDRVLERWLTGPEDGSCD